MRSRRQIKMAELKTEIKQSKNDAERREAALLLQRLRNPRKKFARNLKPKK